ncbi:Putative peptidase [Blastococcus saxobsidens DD2]|uniref:Putative peptidase n=1 Tax=Blastococcus saxobsidens (strain DD2) TaxID=1146883 RepID=H6RN69_BLASD|nr:Putative peptidase [Blastococcus saxobsidens DD2]
MLRSDVYRPVTDEEVPVLLTRHPYGKNAHTMDKPYFDHIRVAAQGYIVVIQDVRGRYASDGEFRSEFQEADDGYDAVEWAAQLPGSSGVVGMFGRSYHALTQWAAARNRPAALRTIAPGFSPGDSMLTGFMNRGGAHEFGSRVYWSHRHALDTIRRLAGGEDNDRFAKLLDEYEAHDSEVTSGRIFLRRPLNRFQEAPPLTVSACRSFGLPVDDRGYEAVETRGIYGDLDVTAFLVAGWYDIFLGSTLSQYEGMRAAALERGSEPPHLLVGPWTHIDGTGRFRQEDYGVHSGTTMLGVDADLMGQHLRWFDAHLKGVTAPLESVSPVRLFVMGTNRWVGFEAFPPPDSTTESWYLQPDGTLAPTEPASSEPSEYVYDPEVPVPTVGGASLLTGSYPAGPADQSVLDGRADILRFESAELTEPLTLVGRLEARVFAETSAVDTDFVARLVDVHPDGRKILVADGIVRASARETFRPGGEVVRTAPTPVEPGRVSEYVIDLWATARTFLPGHRLRVEVTSSSFPRWDPNLNTGRDPYVDAESQPARQRIHHEPGAASRVLLPVLPDLPQQ